MRTRCAAVTLVVLVAWACGCQRARTDQELIRAAIQQHLSGNSTLNMKAMDYEIKDISMTGDHAQAQVEFRLKQGGATMQVTYALARANGSWQILKSQPAGGQIEHPAMNDVHAPPAAAAAPKALPSIDDFFKAPAASDTKSLPPGHPPVNSPGDSSSRKGTQPAPKKP